MGGWNSGRSGGRPVKEDGLTIDLAWLFRSSWMMEGIRRSGLPLTWNGGSSANITYDYDLTDPKEASLTLIYRHKLTAEGWVDRMQHVWLEYTVPPFGGRRWWFICPRTGDRVGKLYRPPGSDEFAGRKALRLGYRSQRQSDHDRALERLFQFQLKLGCEAGIQHHICRPKGMWGRTYAKHLARYQKLHAECLGNLMECAEKLRGRT